MSDVAASIDLPEGWASSRVVDLMDLANGFPFKPAQWKKEGLPIIRIQNLNDPEAPFNYCAEDLPNRFRVSEGDLLFAWSGTPGTSFGAHIWNGGEAWLNQHIFRVAFPEQSLDKRFLRLAINDNLDDYIHQAHGGAGLAHITKGKFESSVLRIPPLAEQKRIVAKVEELLGRVNAARARLAKVPTLLKRFRQSVLAAACSGQLTEDGSVPNATGDGVLPEDWINATVGSVCHTVVDCPHSTPKWTDEGAVCLRTTNFVPGQLDLTEVRYVSEATYRERTKRLEPTAEDVLYSREGGILGIACLMPKGLRACLGQRMMLMRTGHNLLPDYLMHVLNCPATLATVRELTGGTAAPHLNVGDIKAFKVPLPPVDEQAEIVRRVDALFALADKIESRVKAATARVEKITQAILAKAFRGELVPTEAELARQEGRDYEPASALLERIRASRSAVPGPANSSRRKSVKIGGPSTRQPKK